MKKIISAILGLFMSMGMLSTFTSCGDYLDVDTYFHDLLTLDSAFAKRIYVDAWLSNSYQHLQEDCGEFEGGFKFASDELITFDQNCKNYQNGNYSASAQLDEPENRLRRLYETVRKATTFIDNVDNCREMTLSERADYKAQARFLRAYAYWALIRKYGPVPLVPEHGLDVNLSYEELSLNRAPFDEVVDFIDYDLRLAASSLPLTRPQNNMGRPTRGAALGLRTRVLLYAASPLFNGNKDLFNVKNNDGTQLVAQEYDDTKWARAAAAAKDVIDLQLYSLLIITPDPAAAEDTRPPVHPTYSSQNFPNGWADVDPYASYKYNFDGTLQSSRNPELIFTRTYGSSLANFAKDCAPKYLLGNNKVAVTQKAVNAFYMNDGRTIDEAEETGDYPNVNNLTSADFTTSNTTYVPSGVCKTYFNREPRFYASIAFGGSIWECESASEAQFKYQQIFYYRDNPNGKQGFKEECPLTGIGFRKYYNKEDAYTTGGYQLMKSEPTIRYAEILLAYAEALNELEPGKTYTVDTYSTTSFTIQRDVQEIQTAVKQIRMRAGIPDFDMAVYENQNTLRLRLKKERQIELMGENAMRFFDLRRWKDALTEENEAIMGCNINKTATAYIDFYKPTVVTAVPKSFLQKMYLWPFIPDELKRNVNLTQNPGW